MRSESKSMWLRRIGPLGVAGLLVWPLAGVAAETSAAEGEKGHFDLYSAEHQERLNDAKTVESEYLNALMLGRTAEEKLSIKKALKLAEEGKPQEAIELFVKYSKSEADIELFKKLVAQRTAGSKDPSQTSPGAFDHAPAFDADKANKAYTERNEGVARLENQEKAILEMVGQGRFKEAEAAYQALIKKLVRSEKDVERLQDLINQCDFNAALDAAGKLSSAKGDWDKEKLRDVLKNYRSLYQGWSVSLMKDAQRQAKAKNYAEAMSLAQRAQKMDINRTYIKNFIEECQKQLDAASYRKEISQENVTPQYAQDQKEVDRTIREAKIFFRNKQYESAATRLERALLIDPFNLEAVDMLSECYTRIYNEGRKRSEVSVGRAEALNIWEWAEPMDRVQIDPTTAKAATIHNSEKTDVYGKLERIIFPSVVLKDYALVNIITYLNEKSRVYDPDHEGVTIIDNLAPADKQRKMTVEFGKISLLDIVRYISLETGFSYGLSGNKVTFGNVDRMRTEIFPVRGSIISEIIGQGSTQTSSGMKSGDGGEGGGDADGGAGASMSAGGGAGAASVQMGANEEGADAAASQTEKAAEASAKSSADSAALKAYFSERWITFDNGANIIYSRLGERLVVKNTPENLRRMATLLKQLDALEQPMILVEVKLIELADTNLNELGFEWMFSAEHEDGNWTIGTNDPTRHGGDGSQYRLLNDLKILPNFGEKIFGSDVNVDLSLSINAVAQNNRAEVLSSPRILTQSGSKTPAKIQMTEKTYFVTEWEQPDVESNGFSISMDISAPDWDEERDLGVTFTVTPTVESDNYTILLEDIHPVFVEHINDENYDVSYETGTIIDGVQTPVKKFVYHMEMPEFANREITSSLTLYDGETVLLGGMADNESVARSDKWPFLGDVPFFGKFFTDQKTDVTNHSMLIFVTARLVNPNGVPLRSVRDRGIMEFNR